MHFQRQEIVGGKFDAVDNAVRASNEKVEKALARGEKRVVGQDVEPRRAYANLQKALGYVSGYLKFDRKDIYFQKFQGKVVGESTAEGVVIDPIMLMHPAMRLAHVLAHELAHSKNEIQNEGLVEAYVKTMGFVEGKGLKVTDKYNQAMERFHDFAMKVGGGRAIDVVVREIYELYYAGNYEEIWAMAVKAGFEENFWKIFPELDYDRKGETSHTAADLLDSGHANAERTNS